MDARQWNDVLFRALVATGEPGVGLYLFVDRDVLSEVSGLDPQEALHDFSRAFQRHMAWGRPFAPAVSDCYAWARSSCPEPPPFVHALAMTVLAVTEEPLGSSASVYAVQNRLLGLEPVPHEPPGYGEDVPRLWRGWNDWLLGPGARYGRPTARTHEHWTRQGWARSQALVRHRDRVELEHFFEDIGLPEHCSDHPADVLTARFLQWLRYRGSYAAPLRERLEEPAARDVLVDVVREEARRWDGRGRTSRSRGSLRGLVTYDELDAVVSSIVLVDDNLVGRELTVDGHSFEAVDAGSWVELPLPDDPVALLTLGVEVPLAPDLGVRAGGESVYVMQDDPVVGRLVQVRRADPGQTYTLLVRDDRLTPVLTALARHGAAGRERTGPCAGWTWVSAVRVTQHADLLRLLGLAAVVPRVPTDLGLAGGHKVAGTTYLCGGEPDVVLPDVPNPTVTVDDTALAPTPAGQVLEPLAPLVLPPGRHVVAVHGQRISFTTVDAVRDSAGRSDIGWPLAVRGGGLEREARRLDGQGAALAGAALPSSVTAPDPLVLRVPQTAECLLVTQTARLLEVRPRRPPWLERLGLRPAAVDVADTVRSTEAPAFFLVRSPATGRVAAASVPPESTRLPGVAEARLRPDLVRELALQPISTWCGRPDERRFRELVGRMMGAGGRVPAAAPRPWPQQPRAARREDVLEGRRDDNPYDDVLAWLSELEAGTTSLHRFRETWSWTCSLYGRHEQAQDWRGALRRLGLLGHVEVDWSRRRVGVAPAVLHTLPCASGLALLSGSRPVRLLDRLDDTEDVDQAVADAASSWQLHFRTQVDARGEPTGPTTVFVEWDRDARDLVAGGLSALGVALQGAVAPALLGLVRPLADAMSSADELTMSPGRQPRLRVRQGRGRYVWEDRASDAAPGLYRYERPQGPLFAYRDDKGQLRLVDLDLGAWLDRQERDLLGHHPVHNALVVPRWSPLPTLMGRALVLRTGLLPRPVVLRKDGQGPAEPHLVYENVDDSTAGRVARLLGRTTTYVTDELEPLL